MPLYIDLEASSLSRYANQSAYAFISKMRTLGGKPGIYANLNWFNNYIKTANYVNYPLWIAQYNSKITHKNPGAQRAGIFFGLFWPRSSGILFVPDLAAQFDADGNVLKIRVCR